MVVLIRLANTVIKSLDGMIRTKIESMAEASGINFCSVVNFPFYEASKIERSKVRK